MINNQYLSIDIYIIIIIQELPQKYSYKNHSFLSIHYTKRLITHSKNEKKIYIKRNRFI